MKRRVGQPSRRLAADLAQEAGISSTCPEMNPESARQRHLQATQREEQLMNWYDELGPDLLEQMDEAVGPTGGR
jgi:hypothetical protein